MVKVLFFAKLSELAGRDSIEFKSEQPISIKQIVCQLETSLPQALIEALQDESTMVSINQSMAARDDLVHAGDEVAFLPPFSGG